MAFGMTAAPQEALHFRVKNDALSVTLRNTAIVAGLGGLAGITISVLRASPIQPAVAAFRMAQGWAAFSFGFFAIREYVMQPLTAPVWPSCQHIGHAENFAPSFFSGASMGCIAAIYLRRPIIPGVLTVAGLCSILQLGFNELKLGVLRYMGDLPPSEHAYSHHDVAHGSSAGAETGEPKAANVDPPSNPSFIERGVAWMHKYSPIQPLPDDQYRERLLQREREIDDELRLIETELHERRRALSTI